MSIEEDKKRLESLRKKLEGTRLLMSPPQEEVHGFRLMAYPSNLEDILLDIIACYEKAHAMGLSYSEWLATLELEGGEEE